MANACCKCNIACPTTDFGLTVRKHNTYDCSAISVYHIPLCENCLKLELGMIVRHFEEMRAPAPFPPAYIQGNKKEET